MKITVGDVMNSKANVRKYLSVHPENGRIYVDAACFDTVLIDKTEEWEKLQQENQRYREARKKIEERYDKEYDIQANEYMGGIADGLMVAMGIIDKALEGESI